MSDTYTESQLFTMLTNQERADYVYCGFVATDVAKWSKDRKPHKRIVQFFYDAFIPFMGGNAKNDKLLKLAQTQVSNFSDFLKEEIRKHQEYQTVKILFDT